MKIVEIAKVEVTAGERFGEEARVQSFLAAEADAQQLGVGEAQETSWSERADGGFQAVERRFRGGERDLLLENDVDESRKPRLANPERGRAVGVNYADEIWISLSQAPYMRRE